MRRIWIVITVVVLIIVALLVARKSEPPRVTFARVGRTTLVSTLPTNGKAEPLTWESIRSETEGLVTSVPVHLGDRIEPKTLIAQIGQPGAVAALRGAEAKAAQYRSDLHTLEHGGKSETLADIDAQIAKSTFDRDQARREYESLKRLHEKQAATNVEVLVAKARLDAAELSIDSLQKRRTALVSAADVAGGRARVAEADAQAVSAREKLATGTVRSTIGGSIYSLPVRPGSYVNPGDLVANVGDLDQMRVKVFVDEPELGRVRVGLPVRITWDGLPGREWMGAVERMPTEIVPLGARQVGEVWVTIPNEKHDLIPGVTVNAEIRTQVESSALVVPKSAIRRDRGPIGVYVLRDGHLAWQAITLGASDVTNTAVHSGLQEGDIVLLPTDLALKEGDRVRPIIQ